VAVGGSGAAARLARVIGRFLVGRLGVAAGRPRPVSVVAAGLGRGGRPAAARLGGGGRAGLHRPGRDARAPGHAGPSAAAPGPGRDHQFDLSCEPDLSVAPDSVTAVTSRWSTGQVLALAPDASSRRAAAGLAGPSSWSGAGAADGLVWGLCAGSGKHPYQAVVDLAGPSYKCSCPSRKFPCKHVLALLLAWANGTVPEQDGPSGYAQAWQAGRAASAVSRRAAAPRQGAGGAADGKDDASAARRAGQRARRVSAGLAELQTWLRDQVRAGLSGAAAGGYRHAEAIAARMVDAQAPGLASALRRLSAIPASGDGWPARLLDEYAQLHLLARAHDRLGALPPGLDAVVRFRVGYTTSRDEVLASPAVTDRWQVLAARDVLDGPVPARRIWLHGRDTGRFALLLSFAAGGNFGANPDAVLAPGTELHADVHYYPGQPPVRAVTGARHGAAAAGPGPDAARDAAALLCDWAAALAQDPWLTEWPALLAGTPAAAGGRWYLVDSAGAALPLLGRESLWPLLAISGGYPVTVAGEWSPAGLTALTAWHEDQAVSLGSVSPGLPSPGAAVPL
jgi:SWIM zinc finger